MGQVRAVRHFISLELAPANYLLVCHAAAVANPGPADAFKLQCTIQSCIIHKKSLHCYTGQICAQVQAASANCHNMTLLIYYCAAAATDQGPADAQVQADADPPGALART